MQTPALQPYVMYLEKNPKTNKKTDIGIPQGRIEFFWFFLGWNLDPLAYLLLKCEIILSRAEITLNVPVELLAYTNSP